MEGAVPTEQEGQTGKPNKAVEFVPQRDKELIENVTPNAQQVVGPSFSKEQAVPSAAQPIPKTISHIKPGINAEPVFDSADFTDRMGKLTGFVADTVMGKEGLSAHEEKTASGHKGIFRFKERMNKMNKILFHKRHSQQLKKAA